MKLENGYYIDPNQGISQSGRAFGYIGRTVDGVDFCGMFFDWPSEDDEIYTAAERERMLDSLDYAEFDTGVKINANKARAILNRYLRANFDLRETPSSREAKRYSNY